MAFTEDDVAKLETTIASGVLSVQMADGRRVNYNSIADLRAARDAMRVEIQMDSATPPPRTRRVVFVRS